MPKTSYHWRHLIPLLSPHYTVVAPDLRGLGDSEHPRPGSTPAPGPGTSPSWRPTLGFERFRLVGEDWGGATAGPLSRRGRTP